MSANDTLMTIEARVEQVMRTLELPEGTRAYLVEQFSEAAGVEGDRDLSTQNVWTYDFRAWFKAAYPRKNWLAASGDLEEDAVRLLKKGFKAGWNRAVMAARRRLANNSITKL